MSLETPIAIRILQRKLYRTAKAELVCAPTWALRGNQSESAVREIRTLRSMSGDGKRGVCQAAPSYRAHPRLYMERPILCGIAPTTTPRTGVRAKV